MKTFLRYCKGFKLEGLYEANHDDPSKQITKGRSYRCVQISRITGCPADRPGNRFIISFNNNIGNTIYFRVSHAQKLFKVVDPTDPPVNYSYPEHFDCRPKLSQPNSGYLVDLIMKANEGLQALGKLQEHADKLRVRNTNKDIPVLARPEVGIFNRLGRGYLDGGLILELKPEHEEVHSFDGMKHDIKIAGANVTIGCSMFLSTKAVTNYSPYIS